MKLRAKDIAKKLGVSPTTVSLVLNNKPGVGEEMRKRILKEIESLGYESNIRLKNSTQSKNIRFILYKTHGLVIGNTPFFSKLIESIENEASQDECNIIISYVTKGAASASFVENLKEDNIDGIILLATEMQEDDVLPYAQLGIPTLVLDNSFHNIEIDCVQIDNMGGVEKAAQHLIDCGHRDIGYLRSSAYINNFQERYLQYQQTLAKNGIPYDYAKTISLEPTLEGSYRDMANYLQTSKSLPTALLADNDILAVGASRALAETGFDLPEDVSLIGFDDMPYCTLMHPALSTIQVNNASMGILAVRRLIDNIAGRTDEIINIKLRTRLIKRKSIKEINHE